jgi:hypothetical protein
MEQLRSNLDLTQTHSRGVSVVEGSTQVVSVAQVISPLGDLILRISVLSSGVDEGPEALRPIYSSNCLEHLVVRKGRDFVALLGVLILNPA